MDLESESSVLESVEDNEGTIPERGCSVDPDQSKNNGSCEAIVDDVYKSGTGENDNGFLSASPLDMDGRVVENTRSAASPPSAIQAPSGTSSPAPKGYGLKKWRRIRRDVVKDGSGSMDSNKILKRGLSNNLGNPSKASQFPVEIMKNSEASTGSTSIVRNVGVVDGFSLDSRFAAGVAFAAGADSDNSEDQSSKSSTAASVPKIKYDLPAPMGNVREKNKVKSMGGKTLGNLSPRAQQGKVRTESSKKARGERAKIQKENSLSSMESDSRSSNFIFMQGNFPVNGKKGGVSMNFNFGNGDEVHQEVQAGYVKENAQDEEFSQGESAAELSWEAKQEKHGNQESSADQDPLIQSVHALQMVQEALEKEVQKLGEVGNEPIPSDDGLTEGGALHDQFNAESISQSASASMEVKVLGLTENAKRLQAQLEETMAILKVKESRISELEATLSKGCPPKAEAGSTIDLQRKIGQEIEDELEGLFRHKIEAEVEYLAMVATVQKLKVATQGQADMFEKQQDLVAEQANVLRKLDTAKSKAVIQEKQAIALEKSCEDILFAEEILNLQSRTSKMTLCFSVQSILLVLVIWMFVLQLSPESGVVPT